MKVFFFCGGWGLNPEPYIYYALSLPTKLNSHGLMNVFVRRAKDFKKVL